MTIIAQKLFARYITELRLIVFLAVCICFVVGNASTPEVSFSEKSWEKNDEINIFREYLKIRTDHPNINYEPAVEFLKEQAESLDLPTSVYYVNDENPVVVMTWLGSQLDLPSILLNSHMDVVPAFDEFWTYPPFAAEMDEHGNIFARGAQDMKCVGMQYLAAIRALKGEGIRQMKRTIHIIFVPDEEMGSGNGMRQFVHTESFKSMNIGFALDEGLPAPRGKSLTYFFAERATWRMEFTFHGKSGHGSVMYENTAAEKFLYIANKFSDLRKIESAKSDNSLDEQENITSINLTVMKGGLEGNVVPPAMSAIFDVRLAVNADHDIFERQINQWCEEAGGDITIFFHIKDPKAKATIIDSSNSFWTAFKDTTNELNMHIEPAVASGATDSRFMRSLGIPAFGFSPMVNTTAKLHENDEYLNAEVYLAGIGIYKNLISSVANLD